jgi:hypothetical protein
LDKHFEFLISKIGKSKAFKKGALKNEYVVKICIAEFFNTKMIAALGLEIDQKHIQWLAKRKVGLEMITYPCNP